eukprot:403361588
MDKIVQNYYGTGNKYDPRSQSSAKKHYCAVCKIEISGSRSSVMFHEQSKQHQEKKRETIDKSRGGNKQMVQMGSTDGNAKGMRVDPKQASEMYKQQANSALLEEMKRIEEAAFQQYDKKDATGFRYKKLDKSVASIGQAQSNTSGNGMQFDVNMGYQKPKQTKHDDEGGSSFSIEDIKNEPKWSSHYDEDSGEVYYYNRITKKSDWVKPNDFDGYDINSGQNSVPQADSLYQRTFGGIQHISHFPTALENKGPVDQGVVGGWEEVRDEQEDYYKQHSLQNLDEQKRRQFELMDKDTRAKTWQEILQENEDDSEDEDEGSDYQKDVLSGDGNDIDEADDDQETDKLIKRQLDKKTQNINQNAQSVLGKRKTQFKPQFSKMRNLSKRADLVNATEKDLLRQNLKDMKNQIERGLLDEDIGRDIFDNGNDDINDINNIDYDKKDGIKENDGEQSGRDKSIRSGGFGGFKKKEIVKNQKKRQAETSDGEKDN